jgi:hypothetical protein
MWLVVIPTLNPASEPGSLERPLASLALDRMRRLNGESLSSFVSATDTRPVSVPARNFVDPGARKHTAPPQGQDGTGSQNREYDRSISPDQPIPITLRHGDFHDDPRSLGEIFMPKFETTPGTRVFMERAAEPKELRDRLRVKGGRVY